jgi:hypothetical protein
VEIVIMLAFTILHMSVELRTKRPLQLADAEPTQRLFPRWEIVKFLSSKVSWPYPADRVLNVYRNESFQALPQFEIRRRLSPRYRMIFYEGMTTL